MDARAKPVLVVEDDPAVRRLVTRVLEAQGLDVDEAGDALAAMGYIGGNLPDLVIFDVGLTGVPGLDLLAQICQDHDVPVIVLAGAGSEADRVAGLRGGADDYVVKPFYPAELAAWVDRLLRSRTGWVAEVAQERLRFDGLEIDLRSRECRVRGVAVGLTAKEFDLLAFLAGSSRQVFSREQPLRKAFSLNHRLYGTSTPHPAAGSCARFGP